MGLFRRDRPVDEREPPVGVVVPAQVLVDYPRVLPPLEYLPLHGRKVHLRVDRFEHLSPPVPRPVTLATKNPAPRRDGIVSRGTTLLPRRFTRRGAHCPTLPHRAARDNGWRGRRSLFGLRSPRGGCYGRGSTPTRTCRALSVRGSGGIFAGTACACSHRTRLAWPPPLRYSSPSKPLDQPTPAPILLSTARCVPSIPFRPVW